MNLVSKIIKDLATGRDGVSHDLGRYSWICSALGVVGAGIWNAAHGIIFDLVQVASAFGIVAGAHGVAIMAKAKTEPGQEDKQ